MAEPTKIWKVFQETYGVDNFIVDSDGNITFTGDNALTGDQTITGDLTVTGDVSITGSFGVTGTSVITGDSQHTGDIVMNKTGQASFSKLQLAVLHTAPASAGLTKGDIWIHKGTTDVYSLALCVSTAAGTVKRMRRHIDVTLGSAS